MYPPQELIEAPLSSDELAARYRALCDDPMYANVPGKIELDTWGRMVMTPPSYYHGVMQGRLCQRRHWAVRRPAKRLAMRWGFSLPMPRGPAQSSSARTAVKRRSCGRPRSVSVVSPSNSAQEVEEKRIAYLATGAEEVWILYLQSKRYEFHGKQGPLERSRFAVDLAGIFD